MMEKNISCESAPVSFGFKRKIVAKVDESKVVKEKDDDNNQEFLNEVNEDVLNKNPKKKEKLIIPLIKQNKWNLPTEHNGSDANSDLQDQAAREIIKESEVFLEKTISNDSDHQFDDLAVPLLLKNKVPDGWETDDKLNVDLRPDEATLLDYESIPIEAFGMAMLRGMGWDAKVGIGKTFKENVKILEVNARPKGLGLGAIAPTQGKNAGGKHAPNSKEEALDVVKGARVQVQGGSHKKKYGIIEGIDPDNALCLVKFALGGNTASVSELNLKAVGKDEYLKYGKDLSRLTKAHEAAEKMKMANLSHTDDKLSVSDKRSSTKRDKRSFSPSDAELKRLPDARSAAKQHHKHKRSKYENVEQPDDDSRSLKHKRSKDKKQKRHKREAAESDSTAYSRQHKTWLHPNLRVRMIDQNYKKGKYYRDKLIVVDVFDQQGHCSCKTDSGILLDDLYEDMLETVVPRSSSDAYVLITSRGRSKHDGKLAKILEKDKESAEAYLQLIEDRDVALRVSFDDMCEYVGDVEASNYF